MRKILLIILIVLVVILVAVAIYFWPTVKELTNWTKNENSNLNQNVNTVNNANVNQGVNLNLSKETGEIKVDKSVTYKDIVFNITSANEKSEFASAEADSGKKIVVLYLDKITQSTPAEIFTWIKQEVKLTSSQNKDYSIEGIKIIGESAADYDTGYLSFQTPNDEKGFKLIFGAGDKEQIVDLGF